LIAKNKTMKYLKIISAILLFTFIFQSCKKDSTSPTSSTTTDQIVGNWKVSSFVKDSIDLTSQFANYTFSCTSSGAMTIHDNGNSYDCNWSGMNSDHSMYNFHVMGCDDNSVLWECDDDWDLINHDSTHCYFTTHNPNHHSSMTWIKI
jgi:hypothetical protein